MVPWAAVSHATAAVGGMSNDRRAQIHCLCTCASRPDRRQQSSWDSDRVLAQGCTYLKAAELLLQARSSPQPGACPGSALACCTLSVAEAASCCTPSLSMATRSEASAGSRMMLSSATQKAW